ncbi:sulfatase-like hydrolase/transferase, partial [bacterium]|nr:sulfatase-like hydrolase/transferase [bacterium]
MIRLISLWMCLFCLSQATERPNIVVIFCDDMGYGDLTCFGAKGWETPHIDSIARNGVKFTDFYVAQPVCSASRTAL